MTKSKRFSWLRTVACGLAAGLVLLLAGDRGAFTAPPSGIDPLEILNLQVRANAIVLLDSSGSMRERPDADITGGNPNSPAEGEVVGDDPTSKLAIAKNVLRSVVTANQDKVSFQFGRYQQAGGSYGPETDNRFLYTKVCANADTTCQTEANAIVIDHQLAGGSGCANEAGCGVGLFRQAAFVHDDTDTLTKTYYLYAGMFFNGQLVQVRTNGRDGANAANVTAAVSDAGDFAAPYVEVQQITGPNGAPVTAGNPVVRFMYRGIRWNKGNASASCGGMQNLVSLTDCTETTEITSIEPFLRAELPLDTNGNPVGYTNQAVGATPGGPQQPAAFPSALAQGGIRASGFTPLAESLYDIKNGDATGGMTGFNTLWTSTISTLTPRPQTFVIILTDGDDSCTGPSSFDTTSGAAADQRALRAAYQAQLLYTRIVSTEPASGVTTFVVALGSGASSTRGNWIAWGGSGMTQALTTSGYASTRWTSAPADKSSCPTCRDAFVANNTTELTAALQTAIEQGQSSGEFSDQQSITESIFELSTRVNVLTPTPHDLDPTDNDDRFRSSLPVLLQSTFVMPSFEGHLKAFVNNASVSQEMWDAGDQLFDRVRWGTGFSAATSNGMSACAAAGCTFDGGAAPPTNSLRGGTGATITDSAFGTMTRLRRRIYTTSRNGVFTNSNAGQRVLDLQNNVSAQRVVMWPPDSTVDPARGPSGGGTYPAGSLDNALGIGSAPNPLPGSSVNPAALTFTQLGTTFGACLVGTGTNHADCTVGGATPSASQLTLRLERARKEARQIMLAYLAGAKVNTSTGGRPTRTTAAPIGEILYSARTWPMAESTLAAPAIVTPPFPERSDSVHGAEFKLFIEGPRTAANVPVNGVTLGFGLRSPDPTGPPAPPVDADLEPIMSVVYHAANDMLHAFRAAPYPQLAGGATTCARSATQLECGGEELWGFVPYDLLPNVKELLKPPSRDPHVYMLANAVRVADIFVPGNFSRTVGGVTVGGTGVWRTVAVIGRGIGGKYYTALDITVPGPFATTGSLSAKPPIPLWSRGNPDTIDGKTASASNNTTSGNNDLTDFAKMGQSWSVPAVSFVTAAGNTTVRTPGGIEFVAYTGSGYGTGPAATSEGSTFFALDMVTGDVISAQDVGDRASMGYENALVGSPAAYNPDNFILGSFGTSGLGATRVYYPDIHGRVWRTLTAAPTATPVLFGDVGQNQPIANAPALVAYAGTTGTVRPHVFVESGNDNRVAPNNVSTPPFKMFGLRDDDNPTDPDLTDGVDGVAHVNFILSFPDLFRGTTQPATTFGATEAVARVFFVGNRFNVTGSSFAPTPPPCVSSFDGIVFAVGAETGAAAYDLSSADDRSTTLTGQRISNIAVVGVGGVGRLVVDRGLAAQNPPPPPAPPIVGSLAPSPLSDVFMGSSVPGSIPFKMGSTVCK